jgi:hypothetical protein
LRLERLSADRGKQHAIEPEGIARRASYREMAKMGRIKTPAKEGYATPGGRGQARRWLFRH